MSCQVSERSREVRIYTSATISLMRCSVTGSASGKGDNPSVIGYCRPTLSDGEALRKTAGAAAPRSHPEYRAAARLHYVLPLTAMVEYHRPIANMGEHGQHQPARWG